MKGNHFKKIKIMLIAMLFIIISGYMLISTAIAALAQDVDVSKVKNVVDVNLEKYVNYNLDEKKGTLLQLNVKTGIEYEEGTEYVPLSSTGILLNVPKINNKFPQSVEVFEKSTKATNGDEQGKDVRYKYVSETGQIIILTANEEQNGEIYKEYVKDAKDDISIVLDYDESCCLEENTKNQLDITGFVQTKLATQKETKVQGEIKAQIEIEKQVSNVVSSDVKTSDIYNGFIKMNAKNDSNYKTTYNESFGINISKKDLADETKIEIENSFIKNEEKTDIKDISYVSSKINKNRVLDIFGQDGYFKVLDETGKVLAEINKDTQVDKDGNYEIKYADGVSKLFAVFSKPNKVGYININSTKEIEPSFKELDANKLQVISKIKSVNKIKDVQNNEIEKEVYNFEDTKEIEIKNTQSVVKLSVNNAKWTNQKQNDVELNVKLLASESSHSLFKNPIIKILLPEEVEKVVLGNVKVTNGNGLNFKNAEYNNENRILTVTLEGEQAEYLSKNLAEGTNVIIPASIILGQEIESKNTKLGVAYVNEATSEKGMFKVDVEVENFRQVQNTENEINTSVPSVVRQVQRAALRSETPNVETAEGVEIEVVPTRCTDILNNGDTVYEGEFIKYNIKVKNTSNDILENVKLIADLPEGVKYVKVMNNYNMSNHNFFIEDIFEYNEEIRQLPIEIRSLEKGQIINKEFQVRVRDLENNDMEKQIETNIKAYIGDALTDAYRISHEVQKAEYKVSLSGSSNSNGSFRYELNVEGDVSKKVRVKLNLPDNSSIVGIYADNQENEFDGEISRDNSFEIIPGKYIIAVNMEEKFLKQENCNQTTLKASAIVNNKYKSNEAIIIYQYENVTIEISSPTEGENLTGGQEVIYNIKVKNITDKRIFQNRALDVIVKDKLPKELIPISVKYKFFTLNSETYEFEQREKEEELYSVDEEAEDVYNVYEFFKIPHGEEIEIIVKAEVSKIYENAEITNVAIVEDFKIDDAEINNSNNEEILRIGSISSNVIKNSILEFTEVDTGEEPTEPGTPLEPIASEGGTEEELPDDYIGNVPSEDENNQGDEENSVNGENEGQEGNGNTTDKKYSITGLAWKDENEDGQKQDNEERLSGIEVTLVDSNGKDISKTTTDNDGQYAFNNLSNGNYMVVFKYDVSKYRLTEYQKSGVESNSNSDVIKTERSIEGKSTICGVTNLIKLNSTLENIDIGLIENKKFNFKVDKYISKVITTTSNGTNSKDYNNVKLAKTEIKSKEIENASVKVEYKIIITNDGEVPGTVGKVVEKLSSGLKLSSDVNNKTWYKNQDGSLVNTSMSGQIIEPGKKLELELIADVSNNSDIIGNYKNTVILEEINNTLGIVDNNIEDNSSSAELIVSVSTGAIIYISIIIILIAITSLLIFLNKKYGIFKHIKITRLFIFVVFLLGIGVINYSNAFWLPSGLESKPAYNPPEGWKYVSDSNTNDGLYHTRFIWSGYCNKESDINIWGSRCFYKVPGIYGSASEWYVDLPSIQDHAGLCIDPGVLATDNAVGSLRYAYEKDAAVFFKTLDLARKAYNEYNKGLKQYEAYLKMTPTSIAENYKQNTLNGLEQDYKDALDDFNECVRKIDVAEYYSERKSDVKGLSEKYSYKIHNTQYLGETVPRLKLSNLNTSSKTQLKDFDNNYYLVGPLKMTDGSDKAYKSYSNKNTYVFNVEFNKGNSLPYYDTYNASGTKISNTVKPGTYEFYIKVKKSDVENYNGISKISTGITGKAIKRYKNVTYYYRIWWPADLSKRKYYQRVIEKPDGDASKYTDEEPFPIEQDKWESIYWTIDSEIAQFQKVAYLNDKDKDTVAPISGIQFVLRRKSDSTWVKKVNGEIKYGGWDNNVVKLTTDAYGKTPKLIGLSANQEYEVFEILTNELKKYYKEESRIANTDVIKLVSFKAKKGLNTISAHNYRKKAEVILEKRDEFDNERTAAEKINFENVKFVLCRQYYEDLKTVSLEWVAQNKDQNVLYDKNKPIEYVKWDDNNKQNSKKLVVLTATKQKDGKYKTEKITGLEPGYYVAYEFIEGCDSYTNKFNLPDHLKELYKPADTLFAGCKLKNVGYINITNTERNGYKPLLPYNKTNKAQFNILLTNVVDYSKVQIFKTNDEKVPLKGVQFKIYKHEAKPKIDPNSRPTEQPGWVVFNSKGEVTGITQNGNDPNTVLTTDEKGYTQMLSKLRVSDKVYDRYYSVYETYIPDKFRNIYEIDKSPDAVNLNELDGLKEKNKGLPAQYGLLKKKFKAVANKDKLISITVDNPQYYVSLKGNVWEDHKIGKNIKTINNLYGNEDNNISGIIVKLMDKTGKQIKQTITNSDGTYTFDKVLVSEIKAGNYYIEFSYDGLTYQTVNQDKGLNNSLKVGAKTVSIPAANTSKAGETSSRTDLNNSFTALTGDGQKINNTTLNYEKRNDDVYLQNTCEWDWTRTEATNNKKGTVKINTQGAFQVKATIDANYLKNAYTKMKEGYKDNKQELLFTIPNLNLGLYQREQVDLALSKDTYSAQIDINGKKYTYLYGQKLDESVQNLIEKDIPTAQVETSLGVGFERKNPLSDDLKYKAPIHKADAEYELNNNVNANSDGELKVTITYAIGLVNNSPTLYGKVNKIKEYYSSDCTFVDKKVYLDKECTKPLSGVTIENESTLNNAQLDKDTVSRNYKTFDINFGNSGIVLTPKTNKDCVKYIYVKMELPKTSFYDFVNHRVYENKEFRNFAEISSYTTYSTYNANNKTGTLYATFDYNSVPNTINTKNAKLRKYENDSNFAPGLQLVLAEERTLSGVVFKDNIDGTIGRKNAAEKGIQNVTVQLVPINQLTKNTENYTPEFMNVTSNLNNVKKYYNDRGLNANTLTVPTNDKGDYTISGFIPGDYQIRYVWGLNNGDDSTIIKDGKDTKVSVGEYKSTKYTDVSDNKWYLNESANSRAIDSWQERLDFDVNLPASYNDYVTYNTDNSNKVKGNMNSWTPKLDMGVEVVGNQNQNNIVVGEDGIAKYKFDVKSVNFGLIERPQQQLEVKKELTHVRIKDAQDRVIVDAEVTVENGKKTFKNIKDVLYTVFLPESSTSPSGTIKSEIDKDYMPVTLEATYTVTVSNTSQEDYKDSNYYYYYNTDKTNPVTLKPTKVYDYISKDFDVNGSSDTNYKVETDEDYNKEINDSINKGSILYSNSSSKTIIEAAFEKWASSGFKENTLADGTKVTWENWATESRIIKTLYEEWNMMVTTKKPVRTVKLDGSKIINLQALEQKLTAGQSVSTTYTVTSLIQNKDDEIKLDNEVEIIDIDRTKNFGKTTISTYKKLYDAGESVIITPPTGEDRSKEEVNILAISLASGLGVLAIGLIFIKRRISKHNKNA